MNAVTDRQLTAEPARGEVVQTDSASIMAVIARAANDPTTDVDKLERLLGLYERITDKQADQSYSDAMNHAQEAMRPVAADANNPQTKSKYASYGALDRALRPIYTKHGFSLSFDTGDGAPPDYVRVVCRVAHREGHKERPHLDMPCDGKGAKGGDVMTKTHATGAAITYGKRYLLGMIFNIAVGDVEQDGNSNGGREASAACQKAMADINAWTSLDQLKAWKAAHASGLQKLLSANEWRDIVALVNRRGEALKAAVGTDAFPGDAR